MQTEWVLIDSNSRAIELVIKHVFPDIWARYDALRAHDDVQFRPWFSIFHLIAFNMPNDEVSVFCDVHADAKKPRSWIVCDCAMG